MMQILIYVLTAALLAIPGPETFQNDPMETPKTKAVVHVYLTPYWLDFFEVNFAEYSEKLQAHLKGRWPAYRFKILKSSLDEADAGDEDDESYMDPDGYIYGYIRVVGGEVSLDIQNDINNAMLAHYEAENETS